ncbi:MAG: SIMPL domain-containing protein [Candidatus Woesearchaeota archaeon]
MAKINITIIAVTLIIIAGLITGIYFISSKGEGTTISATGIYQTKVMPDEAIVYAVIETRANTAEAAKNENSRISDAVLTSLIKAGIEKKDIQTENFNIYPEYDWSNGTQKLIGYVASNYLKIITKDFNNIGKIIDASVDSGARINYINFELSIEKSNEYKAAALANASLDAKRKAESIATGLGKKLGDLVRVESSDYNYYPIPIYRAMDSAEISVKSVATNIQPTTLDISASVTVIYKVK